MVLGTGVVVLITGDELVSAVLFPVVLGTGVVVLVTGDALVPAVVVLGTGSAPIKQACNLT